MATNLTKYYSYAWFPAILTLILVFLWLFKSFALDHHVFSKLFVRVGGKDQTTLPKLPKKNTVNLERKAIDIFEIFSVYLSTSISVLFLCYWSFSNNVEYALISFLFFAMTFIYFVSSFYRKVTNLHMKRLLLDKEHNIKKKKLYDVHLTSYTILLTIDVLWFCTYCVTAIGICWSIPEVFSNPDRPSFCL